MRSARKPSSYSLLFTYVLPYFAYVLALMLPETLLPRPWAYALAIGASAAGIARAWRWYVPLRGPRSPAGSVAAGLAAGVAGTALWLVIKAPFYEPGGEPWSPAAFWMRVLASTTVVAVFEEMLFRGLLLRLAVTWDRLRRAGAKEPLGDALHEHGPGDVEPGGWTVPALVLSSLAFASGHAPAEWPAATAYGLLMAGLWVWRKDLLSCVVAHGVTNFTLALWVRHTGQWSVW
ncbi:MAG: CPBP family glutamic-type intramembrane protease [Deltaproteobacteria bacterium]|nr:CPBP family glutamic-type intramembrane protease [Deltaproteobacteria bacterium]